MLIRLIVLMFFCLQIFDSFGQKKESIIIEFQKDAYSLRDIAIKKLSTLVDSLKVWNVQKIEIEGHTDNDATVAYNLILSENRVKSVENFLIHAKIDSTLLQASFFGENKPIASNINPLGQQRNRRVEIRIEYLLPIPENKKKPIPVKDDCTKDTMIVLPQGTMVKINACAYAKNPNCVNISEFLSGRDAMAAGLETVSEDGDFLISGGMLDYDICEGVTVTAYMPRSESCSTFGMYLWEQTADGSWSKVNNDLVKEVEIGGSFYYPLQLSGVGNCNLDSAPPLSLLKVKIKTKKGIELNTVSLSCDCQFWVITEKAKNKRKRKAVLRVLCCSETIIAINAVTSNQDTLIFEQRPLSTLKNKNNRGYCSTNRRNDWWIFKRFEKDMYRKYKVRREDFEDSLSEEDS